jgi:hypothetical protein
LPETFFFLKLLVPHTPSLFALSAASSLFLFNSLCFFLPDCTCTCTCTCLIPVPAHAHTLARSGAQQMRCRAHSKHNKYVVLLHVRQGWPLSKARVVNRRRGYPMSTMYFRVSAARQDPRSWTSQFVLIRIVLGVTNTRSHAHHASKNPLWWGFTRS